MFPAPYDFADLSTSPKERVIVEQEEPIHIVMIAIKADPAPSSDAELSDKFHNFCQQKVGRSDAFIMLGWVALGVHIANQHHWYTYFWLA